MDLFWHTHVPRVCCLPSALSVLENKVVSSSHVCLQYKAQSKNWKHSKNKCNWAHRQMDIVAYLWLLLFFPDGLLMNMAITGVDSSYYHQQKYLTGMNSVAVTK